MGDLTPLSLPRKLAGAEQDGVEHDAGEAAGVRVLAAGVVAGDEHNGYTTWPDADTCLRAVGESRTRRRGVANAAGAAQDRVPCDLAQGHNDPHAIEHLDLPVQEGRARGELGGRWLVVRRRAARGCRD